MIYTEIINYEGPHSILASLAFIWIFCCFFSCSSEDCQPMDLPVTNLEDEYQCVNTKYQMEVSTFENFTIINTQAEFEDNISGSCSPIIDFEKYTLIAGKIGLPNGNTSIEYKWTRNCPNSDYTLQVTFFNNATTEAPNLTYHALVNKIEQGSNVVVEILIN